MYPWEYYKNEHKEMKIGRHKTGILKLEDMWNEN